MPHDLGVPLQLGAADSPPIEEAKTESFLASLVEPQCGQAVPSQCVLRTSSSLSRWHPSQ
jgi:hypothetical protein